MKFLFSTYNDLINKFKYRSHTNEVFAFVKQSYPTLSPKSILGPLFDNEENRDSSERESLFYLVTFKKDCPENQIHLQVDKVSKKVSEVERYY